MEGVGVVECEDEDGGLRVFVVAGGDAGHPLHPCSSQVRIVLKDELFQ